MVGDYCRTQRNGRTVADTIGEREKSHSDEANLDCPNKKQQAERDMKGAQRLLASKPVGSMAEH
jgi:hypothetical protein